MINKLVFRRFSDAAEIVAELITLGAECPELQESYEFPNDDSDLELDGCLNVSSEEPNEFTLSYVKTRDGNYLITEARYWDEED